MEFFTHAYCDYCDSIQPVLRNGHIACGVCGYHVVVLDESERGYCLTCERFQRLQYETLHVEDDSGRFVGGDVLCAVCRYVIATVYYGKDLS